MKYMWNIDSEPSKIVDDAKLTSFELSIGGGVFPLSGLRLHCTYIARHITPDTKLCITGCIQSGDKYIEDACEFFKALLPCISVHPVEVNSACQAITSIIQFMGFTAGDIHLYDGLAWYHMAISAIYNQPFTVRTCEAIATFDSCNSMGIMLTNATVSSLHIDGTWCDESDIMAALAKARVKVVSLYFHLSKSTRIDFSTPVVYGLKRLVSGLPFPLSLENKTDIICLGSGAPIEFHNRRRAWKYFAIDLACNKLNPVTGIIDRSLIDRIIDKSEVLPTYKRMPSTDEFNGLLLHKSQLSKPTSKSHKRKGIIIYKNIKCASDTILLISKTKQRFYVFKRNICKSHLLENALEGEPDAKEIDIPHIDDVSLDAAVTFIHHGTIPVDMSVDETLSLLLAANYLAIDTLLTLLVDMIASLIEDKTARESCRLLGVRRTITDEELLDIHEQEKLILLY